MRLKRHLSESPGSFIHCPAKGVKDVTLLVGPHLFTGGEQISPKPTLSPHSPKIPCYWNDSVPLQTLIQHIFVFGALFTRTTLTDAEKA